MWDVDTMGGYEYVGPGDIWEVSVPSAQFCCELKTALKKINLVFKGVGYANFRLLEARATLEIMDKLRIYNILRMRINYIRLQLR